MSISRLDYWRSFRRNGKTLKFGKEHFVRSGPMMGALGVVILICSAWPEVSSAEVGIGYQNGWGIRIAGSRGLALDFLPSIDYSSRESVRLEFPTGGFSVDKSQTVSYGLKIGASFGLNKWSRFRLGLRFLAGVEFVKVTNDLFNPEMQQGLVYANSNYEYDLQVGPEMEYRLLGSQKLALITSITARLVFIPSHSRKYLVSNRSPGPVKYWVQSELVEHSWSVVFFDRDLLGTLGIRFYF